jgi:hypothetical protein
MPGTVRVRDTKGRRLYIDDNLIFHRVTRQLLQAGGTLQT